MAEVFRSVCSAVVDDDGMIFLSETITAQSLRPETEVRGVRLRIEGRLGAARVALQVDVGFGDANRRNRGDVRAPANAHSDYDPNRPLVCVRQRLGEANPVARVLATLGA